MEPRRVALVYGDRGPGASPRYKVTSGYRLSDRLILTVGHLLEHTYSWKVYLDTDSSGRAASVLWHHEDYDVALLKLLQSPGDSTAPVRIGAVSRSNSKQIPCTSAGYPAATYDMDAKQRDRSQIDGTLKPASTSGGTGMRVHLDSAPPPSVDPDSSPWQGMSGAGVFVAGSDPDAESSLLVAVIYAHRPRAGTSVCEVVMLAEITDPGWALALESEQVDPAPVPALAPGWNPAPTAVQLHHERLDTLAASRSPVAGHRVSYVPGTPPSLRPLDLVDRLERMAQSGAGQRGLLVTGGPGVGKSRILLEAASEAERRGWIPVHVVSGGKPEEVGLVLRRLHGRVLLVIDDAALLADLIPQHIIDWSDVQSVDGFAVLAAARTAWWEQSLQLGLGRAWPLREVRFSSDPAQLKKLTARAVREIAPEAAAQGRRHLEMLCGGGTVAAYPVLLAEYCRGAVGSGMTLRQLGSVPLASGPLVTWLDRLVRLLDLRAPLSDDHSDHRRRSPTLLAAALLTASAPATRTELEEAVASIPRDLSPAVVHTVTDKLLSAGLLDQANGTLRPVHDTVADHLLAQAVLLGPEVLSAELNSLLETCLARPLLLPGLVRALGRLSQAEPECGTGLATALRAWIPSRVDAIAAVMAQPIGAQVIFAMLSSGLWKDVLREYDRVLLGPAAEVRGADERWADSLVMALTVLDTTFTREVEAAWRATNTDAQRYARMVWHRLAWRTVPAEQRLRMTAEALEWLEVHGRKVAASSVLARLLRPSDDGGLVESDPRLPGVVDQAMAWVRAYGTGSNPVASACLRHPAVQGEQLDALVCAMLDDLSAEHTEDASYVVAAAVRRLPDLSEETRTLVGEEALGWIERNWSAPGVPYVLGWLLKRLDNRASMDKAIATALAWLDERSTPLGAGRVLTPLLVLLEKGGWGKQLNRPEVRARLREHSLLWVNAPGLAPREVESVMAKVLLSDLLDDAPEIRRAFAMTILERFEQRPDPDPDQYRKLVQPLIKPAPGSLETWPRVREVVRKAVARHPKDQQTLFLISSWAERKDSTAHEHAEVLEAAWTWLGAHHGAREALKLISICLAHPLTDDVSRRRFGRDAVRRFGPEALEDYRDFHVPRHGLTPSMARYLPTGAPEWTGYVEAICAVLENPDADHIRHGRTVRTVLERCHELPPELVERFLVAVLRRIRRRDFLTDDYRDLRRILESRHCQDPLKEEASEAGLHMLQQVDAVHSRMLETLLTTGSLSPRTVVDQCIPLVLVYTDPEVTLNRAASILIAAVEFTQRERYLLLPLDGLRKILLERIEALLAARPLLPEVRTTKLTELAAELQGALPPMTPSPPTSA